MDKKYNKIKFYTCKQGEEYPGFGVWFWVTFFEDVYFTIEEFAIKHNDERWLWWMFQINICNRLFVLEIPIKRIGWLSYIDNQWVDLKVRYDRRKARRPNE